MSFIIIDDHINRVKVKKIGKRKKRIEMKFDNGEYDTDTLIMILSPREWGMIRRCYRKLMTKNIDNVTIDIDWEANITMQKYSHKINLDFGGMKNHTFGKSRLKKKNGKYGGYI